MWQLFSSPHRPSYQRKEFCKNVCMTVRPQMDVSGTWMTTRYQYVYLDILTQSYHQRFTDTSKPPAHIALL